MHEWFCKCSNNSTNGRTGREIDIDIAIDIARTTPNIVHTHESALVAEIERAKRRIQTQITDAMDRRNLRVDTILKNTLARTTQDHYVHHSTDTNHHPRHLFDICAAAEIKRTQDSMDAEIARLHHLSNLMHTLYHGIERATLDLQQELRVTLTIAKDSPTIANESPTIAQESPTIAKESLAITNANPTIANESPTIANESPTIANEILAIANKIPTNAQEIPTIANERPTSVKDRLALANEHLTLANENPTIANESLTIINGRPSINEARPIESTSSVEYNHNTVEFLLMITDHSQQDDDEQATHDMDAERTEALQLQLLQLGLENNVPTI
jgi:hypothetical protein